MKRLHSRDSVRPSSPRRPRRTRTRSVAWLLFLAALLAACSHFAELDGAVADTPRAIPLPPSAWTQAPPTAPDAPLRWDAESLAQALSDAVQMSGEQVLDRAARPLHDRIGYAVDDARYLDLIADSPVTLSGRDMDRLRRYGFAITAHEFPTFAAAYDHIYVNDLPVYISADMLQYSIHRSYDRILQSVEQGYMRPQLQRLLTDLRHRLADGAAAPLGARAEADLDVYLAVALGLLNSGTVAPVAGGDPALIADLLAKARAANGAETMDLFGSSRILDFSQFEPRGHYTDSQELERYFRAMMWLGRIDLRLLEVEPDGSVVFNRRQFDLAAGLAACTGHDGLREQQRQMAETIATFVGRPDSMTLEDWDALMADLGTSTVDEAGLTALNGLADGHIQSVIEAGRYGLQHIASHVLVVDPDALQGETAPLPASMLLFGQAYVIDSHVFSQLVYDRIQSMRMMPNPLDVAYTVLANDDAAALLGEDMARYADYAGALQRARVAVDAHDTAFWEESLYNLWLNALRQLSPGAHGDPAADDPGLPRVFTTEAWARRVLNTQMASWAELRHDTILYAKQSYTAALGCDYPDVYVDPYPDYFRAVADYANAGHEQVAALGLRDLDDYFTRLGEVATTLAEMAQRQRDGLPVLEEHLAFINEMIRIEDQGVCAPEYVASGWYGELFAAGADPLEFDPTIADVHTQPTDEAGSEVGRILHVGTGRPRLMTVVVDTPDGPRAYVGAVSSYYEVVTDGWERLTDEEWAGGVLDRATPAGWMMDLLSH